VTAHYQGMEKPTIHLNGSPQIRMYEQYQEARCAVRKAMARRSLIKAELQVALGKCSHGRNWGDFGMPNCEAVATYVRNGFPDRFACEYHGTVHPVTGIHVNDPGWVRISSPQPELAGEVERYRTALIEIAELSNGNPDGGPAIAIEALYGKPGVVR
jgi:hypothetical protein